MMSTAVENTTSSISDLPYNPQDLPRELSRHYIKASEEELQAMQDVVGVENLRDLYRHIAPELLFAEELNLPEELSYEQAMERMSALAAKNQRAISLLGDGLPDWQVPEIVGRVCAVRKLATSYTPYQPERSQGTLIAHWIYQCLLSQLTGFEAVNSSLYDRSTAIFEAICCATRQKRGTHVALIPEVLYPGDAEVLATMVADTQLRLLTYPVDPQTGVTDVAALQALMAEQGSAVAGVVYMQVNGFGLLEPVDVLTDLIHQAGVKAIAVIDPILLATGALKPPSEYGERGADIFVGEAQHLAIGPNFGGPGLGIFGVRHNEKVKNDVRTAPGRYIGRAQDEQGRDCHVMVMSTREQHIRKDKATSNICSNQAFLATLAGAALLQRGDAGLAEGCALARRQAVEAVQSLTTFTDVQLAFAETAFFNEIVLTLPQAASEVMELAAARGVHLGVDVTERLGRGLPALKLSFSDRKLDWAAVVEVFSEIFGEPAQDGQTPVSIAPALLRSQAAGLHQVALPELTAYYQQLGEQNLSPDEACYPLGSCTMKYNPYLNEWAAGLSGFTDVHPQAPLSAVQGNLELLYEIQQWFCGITGLAGVTTQPVAGAQGELVGLKMFQAYHRSLGQTQRDVMLIPKSAHGTNFATAAMAGFVNGKVEGRTVGIVLLDADESGRINLEDLDAKIAEHGQHISGIMVTNPNTGGVFETDFKLIADKIHAVGGLVYMDGANMNAICGWVDLGAMGVDALHNNLHKTWTIPHGGGGPGDAIVAVSEKLVDFFPGYQIVKEGAQYRPVRAAQCIGSFHRHWGNFAHKVRCYTYLLRLGKEGVRRISGVAVLASRYLYQRLTQRFPVLPVGSLQVPRMHEFIITLSEESFAKLEGVGIAKAAAIPRVGKAFLDFGYHSPTVAFPEVFGLMIEPTESYSQAELDRFVEAVLRIQDLIEEKPEVLLKSPYFTPIDRVDEVSANRGLQLFESLESLPVVNDNRQDPAALLERSIDSLYQELVALA